MFGIGWLGVTIIGRVGVLTKPRPGAVRGRPKGSGSKTCFKDLLDPVLRVKTGDGRVLCYRFEGERCLVIREKTLSNLEKNLRVSLSL
jgi:hypothetical protein